VPRLTAESARGGQTGKQSFFEPRPAKVVKRCHFGRLLLHDIGYPATASKQAARRVTRSRACICGGSGVRRPLLTRAALAKPQTGITRHQREAAGSLERYPAPASSKIAVRS